MDHEYSVITGEANQGVVVYQAGHVTWWSLHNLRTRSHAIQ